MRSYAHNLSVGVNQDINVPGNHFRLIEATSDLYVAFDNGIFIKFKAGQGISFGAQPFGKLTLKTLVNQNVLIVAGVGEFHDDNESVNVTTSATVSPGNALPVGGDVSLVSGVGPGATTIIYAADANAFTVLIKADILNTEAIRVGGSGVGASGGYPLEPGESISLSTTALIAAFNPSTTTAQNMHVLPVRNI